MEEREKAASSCLADLKITIPTLVDDMKDSVGNAYSAHPDRLFIINAEGKVAYSGGRGPWGFKPDEMKAALEKMLK